MKQLMMLFISLTIILSACSSNQDQKDQSDEKPPELLEVTIQTPDTIQANQEVTIEALVVQGTEKVTNADEVKFEIWKSGENEHEMLKAGNEKNGVYSVKKTFKEGGNYFIVAHTTANRMHSMPKKEVTVEGPEQEGALQNTEHEEADESKEHEQTSESSDHGHGDHHNSAVNFDLHVKQPVTSNETKQLMVQLSQGDEPLPEATVRFEIWKEGETKHQFVDAKENTAAAYSSEFTFAGSGIYHVKIHVEKGTIHDHTEKTIEVK